VAGRTATGADLFSTEDIMKRFYFAGLIAVAITLSSGAFAQGDLIGMLTKELGVTTAQAQGGAGALFNLAKSQLSAADFGKVSKAFPGIDSLLKAAPQAGKDAGGAASAVASKAGGLASLADTFTKLGLKPTDVARFAPAILKHLGGTGAAGAEAVGLLSKVWK
jgi:hypothetical protein